MSEWEKQDFETDAQYSYFMAYVKLGPLRSISKLVKQLEQEESKTGLRAVKSRSLQEYSRLNNWVERAGKYDIYLNQQILEATKNIIIQEEYEMAEIRLRFIRELDKLIEEGKDINIHKRPYWFNHLSMALDREMQGLRLHRGLTTERVEVNNHNTEQKSFQQKLEEAKLRAIERRKENEEYEAAQSGSEEDDPDNL